MPEESIFSVAVRADFHPRPISIGGGAWLPARFTALFDDSIRPVYGELVVEVSAEGEPYIAEMRVRPRITDREEVHAQSVEAAPAPPRRDIDRSKSRDERLKDAIAREPAGLVREGEAPPDDRVTIGDVQRLTSEDLRLPVASLLEAAVRAATMKGDDVAPGTRAGPGRALQLAGADPAARPSRRRTLTPELLAEVAEVWRRAKANGEPTREAVADYFGLEKKLTARNWIAAARADGYLEDKEQE